jgi:flagellar hook-associated protein 2
MSSSGFSLSNVVSGGIDVQSTVTQLMAIQRQPETQLKNQQSALNTQASAIGTITGALSTLQSKIQVLTDFTGQLGARTVTSSNTAVITASADGTSQLASHQITVNNLAQTSSFYTGTVATSSTPIAQGGFDINIGGTKKATITIDSSNNTLDGLAQTINSSGAGVTASVVIDSKGARLSLLSSTSGTAGEISIANNTSGQTFTEANQGKDASINVDGISLTTGSNTVTGVLPGVTLNLLSASPNTPIQIGVAPDTAQASTAVQSFVTAYNTAIQVVNAQFVYDPTTNFSQPLGSDPSLMLVQQQLYSAISQTTPGQNNGIDSLAKLGITVANDGTLTVDSSKLSSALQAQPQDVQNFFQNTTSGFASKFNTTLTNMTDTTTGGLQVELNTIHNSVADLTKQINDFEDRLTSVQQNLLTEYSKINATLQSMPSALSSVQSQLSSLG